MILNYSEKVYLCVHGKERRIIIGNSLVAEQFGRLLGRFTTFFTLHNFYPRQQTVTPVNKNGTDCAVVRL